MTTGKPESIQEGSSKNHSKCFLFLSMLIHQYTNTPLPLNRFKKTIDIISVPIASSPAGNLTRFPLGTEARSLEQAVSCAADIRACPTPWGDLRVRWLMMGCMNGTFRNLVGKFDEFFIVC